LREGAPYEVEFEGNVVNPLAHLVMHAAVNGQIEQVPEGKTAFEKMVATGTPAHHAEHGLAALVGELMWGLSRASKRGAAKAKERYDRSMQKLREDSTFREKMTKRFGASRAAFE